MTFPDHPLRLAVGSHEAGSGQGCAMNVISWESGDSTITDMPECADRVLAKIVQRVNDTICTHEDDLLCPDCSVKVLALAHRTVGTGGPADLDRRRVWVRIAADQAGRVVHLASDPFLAGFAIRAAKAWAADPSEENRALATTAADAARIGFANADGQTYFAAAAAQAAALAASGVYVDDGGDEPRIASDAAIAARAGHSAGCAAAAFGDAPDTTLGLAHRAIDLFNQLTGHVEHEPDQARTERAVAAMTAS